MNTIHLPQNTTLPELRRVLELIQKQSTQQVQTAIATTPQGGSGISVGGSASVGPQGPQGPAGPAGADGSTTQMLVGANHQVEVLVGPTGDVLTDNWGLALMGVNVSSTVITGAGSVSIEVLNAS